jgi:hypothetical protein
VSRNLSAARIDRRNKPLHAELSAHGGSKLQVDIAILHQRRAQYGSSRSGREDTPGIVGAPNSAADLAGQLGAEFSNEGAVVAPAHGGVKVD